MDVPTMGVAGSVHVLTLVSFIVFVIYFFSEKTLETHAMVGIIGYHLIYIGALVWYYADYAPYSTLGGLFFSLIFIFISTGMANRNHGCSNTAHNWFAWLAITFSVLVLLVLAVTKFLFTLTSRDDLLCVFLGTFGLIAATITLISGMMYNYINWANRCLYCTHICTIVIYVLLTIGNVLRLSYT